MMGEWSMQKATILSTSALPALVARMAIASVPQGSTDVMNVMPFILLGLKTIFYHHAKFCQKTPPKNAPTMTRSISRKIKNLWYKIHIFNVDRTSKTTSRRKKCCKFMDQFPDLPPKKQLLIGVGMNVVYS